MTFINLALAIGSAACVIPLAIHLLNRKRFEVIEWGAMHLLAPIVKTNRKRIRLEQLILLLIRMLILALLALCMAAPVVTGWRALSGNARSSLALVLDNSYSMDAGAAASTNLQVAKREAAKLVQQGRRGSDVSIALMAGGKILGSSAPSTNRTKIASDLNDLASGFGTAQVGQSLEFAASSFRKMQHAKRDLVIVSDFQANDWSVRDATDDGEDSAKRRLATDRATSLQQAREMIDSMPLKPTITLMQVGTEATDNVSIQSLDISPEVVAVNQKVSIRVNLRNHGEVPYPRIRVNLKVDGKDRTSQLVDLGPNEDAQILLHETFEEAGSHIVEVVADADPLHADNSFAAVIPVWNRLPVLLVDGDPQAEALKSETAFLRLALSPFLSAESVAESESLPSADLLDAKTIPTRDLSQATLEDPRVLVLANVPRLTGDQVSAIKNFVQRGNSLLIFAGDRIDPAWYRQAMAGDLMAVDFAKLHSQAMLADPRAGAIVRPVAFKPQDAQEASKDKGLRIASDAFEHPALELFNDRRNGNLREATFETWYQLQTVATRKPSVVMLANQEAEGRWSGATAADASVLARLSNGDPLLVENRFGDGRVIVCATACDDAWSNLPVRPAFVPLMQRLVTYLATAVQPSRNIMTGETLVAHMPDANGDITITGPDGVQASLAPEDREGGLIEFAETAAPGIYTVAAASQPVMHYAVSAPRAESNLKRLDDSQMEALAESLGANLASSASQYSQQDSDRRYGREIWRHLYWLMLALVVAEVFLQQIFAGVRSLSLRSPAS